MRPRLQEVLARGGHVLVNASLGAKPTRASPGTKPVSPTTGTTPTQQAAAAVPDIVGQDEQTATNALQQAGFTVDEVDVAVDSADQDGIVQNEQPAGGANAPAGSAVTIYVGRFSQTG